MVGQEVARGRSGITRYEQPSGHVDQEEGPRSDDERYSRPATLAILFKEAIERILVS